MVIIPQDVIPHKLIDDDDDDDDEESEEYEDDSDSDDSDDEDDDDDDEKNDNKKRQKLSENIGDIEQRLKKSKVVYVCRNAQRVNMVREFDELYKKFRSKMSKHSRKQKDNLRQASSISASSSNDHVEDNKDNNKNEENKEQESKPKLGLDDMSEIINRLPHRKRLVIVVDRRLNKDDIDCNEMEIDETKQTKIWMYEPEEYKDIPKGYVKEWYFESSFKNIIPHKSRNKIIRSKSTENGWINIFSFHIEQKDEIRCYLYRTGEIMRFEPNDVLNLFEKFFNLNDSRFDLRNKAWIQNQRKLLLSASSSSVNHHDQERSIIESLDWKDRKFDLFCEKLTS